MTNRAGESPMKKGYRLLGHLAFSLKRENEG